MGFIFGTLLVVLAIFLILLVLVQRGRGGGLTGALGGMGGSSAFGAKAGDIFTRITIVTAGIWICVCAAAFYWANNQSDRLGAVGTSTRSLPAQTGAAAPPATEGSTPAESSVPAADGAATPATPPVTPSSTPTAEATKAGTETVAPPASDAPPAQ